MLLIKIFIHSIKSATDLNSVFKARLGSIWVIESRQFIVQQCLVNATRLFYHAMSTAPQGTTCQRVCPKLKVSVVKLSPGDLSILASWICARKLLSIKNDELPRNYTIRSFTTTLACMYVNQTDLLLCKRKVNNCHRQHTAYYAVYGSIVCSVWSKNKFVGL